MKAGDLFIIVAHVLWTQKPDRCQFTKLMHCGSGFPAAIRNPSAKTPRGWKAAPTSNGLAQILSSMRIRCLWSYFSGEWTTSI